MYQRNTFLRRPLISQKLLWKCRGKFAQRYNLFSYYHEWVKMIRTLRIGRRMRKQEPFLGCRQRSPFEKFSTVSPIQLSITGGPTLRQLRIWRGKWGQCSVLLLWKTWGSQVNGNLAVINGNWNITSFTEKEHKLIKETTRYSLDFVSISSTTCRGSNTIQLDDGWKPGLWSRSRGVGVGRIFNLRSRSRRKF